MEIQKQYADMLGKMISIANDCEVNSEKLMNLLNAVNEKPILVPVVGEFSAGKSSLLNQLMGKKVLPTGMEPVTPLPAELYYSENEHDEGITLSGEVIQLNSIDEASKKFVCLRRYINSEFLKAIQPVILVDMPGFDSPLDAHNQAIFNYLDKGSHYIIVTPADAGTVSASMTRQISNIQSFKKNCSFVISKTDLRSPEEVAEVKNSMAEIFADMTGETQEVFTTSQNDADKVRKFIESLDPNALLRHEFEDFIKESAYNLKCSLNTKISCLKSDKEERQNHYKKLKFSIEKLQQRKEREVDAAKENNYEAEADQIASAVGNALSMELDSLTQIAASSGKEALQAEINGIVQSVVTSRVNCALENISAQIAMEFNQEISASSMILDKLADKDLSEKMQKAANTLFDAGKSSMNNFLDRLNKNKDSYRMLTGVLAAATSVINPIVEVVIIMLPDILNMIFGSIQQNRQNEQIRQSIQNQIPNIKRQVRAKVQQVLKENGLTMINQIAAHYDEELAQKMAEIKAAEEECEASKDVAGLLTKYDTYLTKITEIYAEI